MKADAGGNLDGSFELGRMFRYGLGGEKDENQARALFMKADACD